MRLWKWAVVLVLAGVVFGFGCSGTSGDGGGPNGTDNGDGTPADYSVMVGTCDSRGNGTEACAEYWHVSNEDAQNYAAAIEQSCSATWTSDEPVCPTSGDYIGTCISTGDEEKSKIHYYEPDILETLRESCESGGDTWVVE